MQIMTDCSWLPEGEEQLNRQRRGWKNKKTGEAFEETIAHACERYKDKGIAEIEKTPEPIKQIGAKDRRGQFRACYQKKAQPDFKGTLRGGTSVVFEAKHTDGDRIAQSAVTEDQEKRLERHWRLGAIAFVLVSLGQQDFYRVPWATWRNMKTIYGHKHMKKEDLEQFRVEYKNGTLRFLEAPGDSES